MANRCPARTAKGRQCTRFGHPTWCKYHGAIVEQSRKRAWSAGFQDGVEPDLRPVRSLRREDLRRHEHFA